MVFPIRCLDRSGFPRSGGCGRWANKLCLFLFFIFFASFFVLFWLYFDYIRAVFSWFELGFPVVSSTMYLVADGIVLSTPCVGLLWQSVLEP